MKGQQSGLMLAVIMMVLLVLIGAGFYASAQGIGLKDIILGKPTVGETIRTIEGGIYDEQREIDLTLDTQPTTATLIGCQIAKAITSDFIERGETERSVISEGSKDSLISHAPFQIKWNAAKNSYWKSGDFGLQDSDGDGIVDSEELKRVCSNTGASVECPTNLDETCISAQLKNIRVGSDKTTPICTGESKVIAGGKSQSFGNDKCFVKNNWNDCKNLCLGGDKIKSWKASGGEDSSISVTGVASDVVRANDMNFEENAPPECESGAGQNCEPRYEWSVFWNNEDKAYKIEIPRIPLLEELGSTPAFELGKTLASYFSNGDRTNLVGIEQPEMRTIYRATFIPSQDYQFNDFAWKDFKQNVEGNYWDIKEPIEYCGESCDTTIVPIINFNRKIFDSRGEWYKSTTVSDKWKKEHERKIRLRIGNSEGGVLAENTLLKKEHRYKIILNRYRGPERRTGLPETACDFGVVGVWYDNGKFECGGYLQGKNPSSGCSREECDAYNYWAPIDYSLTIIDLGPISGVAEPRGVCRDLKCDESGPTTEECTFPRTEEECNSAGCYWCGGPAEGTPPESEQGQGQGAAAGAGGG